VIASRTGSGPSDQSLDAGPFSDVDGASSLCGAARPKSRSFDSIWR